MIVFFVYMSSIYVFVSLTDSWLQSRVEILHTEPNQSVGVQ